MATKAKLLVEIAELKKQTVQLGWTEQYNDELVAERNKLAIDNEILIRLTGELTLKLAKHESAG